MPPLLLVPTSSTFPRLPVESALRRLLLALLLLVGTTVVARGAVPCEVLEPQPACYVALLPGPLEDTLGLTQVEGPRTFPSTGHLLLTTVAVDSHLDVADWVQNGLDRRIRQVPRDTIFPPDRTSDEQRQVDAQLMRASQLDATLAALTWLGHDLDDEYDGARIIELIEPNALEPGQLEVGDVIVAVDGTPTLDNAAVAAQLTDHAPGDTVVLTVRRGDDERDVTVTLAPHPEREGAGFVGVRLESVVDLPVDVAIDAGVIGGPSAGLMFALAIIERLGPDDLTGGETIAGTGAIDPDGTVHPIGGITQKIVAASTHDGEGGPASVFLVPRGNFEEAQRAPAAREILLIPVGTLEEALDGLAAVREGREPAGAVALAAG